VFDKASASWLKDGPPLPRAKPMSNSGSASVITYLRKGRKKLGSEMAVKRQE